MSDIANTTIVYQRAWHESVDPGSALAAERGCTCPSGIVYATNGVTIRANPVYVANWLSWRVANGCPLHDPRREPAPEERRYSFTREELEQLLRNTVGNFANLLGDGSYEEAEYAMENSVESALNALEAA